MPNSSLSSYSVPPSLSLFFFTEVGSHVISGCLVLYLKWCLDNCKFTSTIICFSRILDSDWSITVFWSQIFLLLRCNFDHCSSFMSLVTPCSLFHFIEQHHLKLKSNTLKSVILMKLVVVLQYFIVLFYRISKYFC